VFEQFEDRIRLTKSGMKPFQSPYQDFVLYPSSVTNGIWLGMNVIKPVGKAPLLIELHGWHMSMPKPVTREEPLKDRNYLIAQIDMRGRAFSEGQQDCNGLELIDIWDAVQYVREHYRTYMADPEVIYLEGGSGGGGNALACVAKFPDLFAAATALCGISDYRVWYEQDAVGEFRDEMDIWIAGPPSGREMAYQARSGLHLCENVLTPLYIAHGETDVRVPAWHSRAYVERMNQVGKSRLVQYDELPGVGTRDHYGNATAAQMQAIREASERNRQQHREPMRLPERGRMIVGGYLYTRSFHLMLESMDALAELEYDLEQAHFHITADQPYSYELQLPDGTVLRGTCGNA
jgi:pimeloyl-ACP methyl ester carboxylesterase